MTKVPIRRFRQLGGHGAPAGFSLAVCVLWAACTVSASSMETAPPQATAAQPEVARPLAAADVEPAPSLQPQPVLAPEPELPPESEPEVEPEAEPAVPMPEVSPKLRARILAIQAQVNQKARKYELDPALLNGLIWVESKFDPKAKGPAGAQGLLQLMPRTAKSLAKRLGRRARSYDVEFNLDAGALYLSRLLRRFDGDTRMALAAYNRGAGRVLGWIEAGEALPDRTQAYVDRVLAAKDWIGPFVTQHSPIEETPALERVSLSAERRAL